MGRPEGLVSVGCALIQSQRHPAPARTQVPWSFAGVSKEKAWVPRAGPRPCLPSDLSLAGVPPIPRVSASAPQRCQARGSLCTAWEDNKPMGQHYLSWLSLGILGDPNEPSVFPGHPEGSSPAADERGRVPCTHSPKARDWEMPRPSPAQAPPPVLAQATPPRLPAARVGGSHPR